MILDSRFGHLSWTDVNPHVHWVRTDGGTQIAMGSKRQFADAVQRHSLSHVGIGDHLPMRWTSSDVADNLFAESRCQLGTAYFLRGTVRTGSLVRVSPSGLAS